MIRNSFILIIIFIFILFLLLFINNSLSESFTNTNNTIILLGDSILNNSNFVPTGKSVIDILSNKNPNIINYAKDESTISDIIFQLNSISTDLTNHQQNVIISAGGNNILQFNNQINIKELFNQYIDLIKSVQSRLPNSKIYVLNLYLPSDTKFSQFKSSIIQWNNLLQTNKIKYNYNIIDISTLLNSPTDFINGYEPSISGGEKIANLIQLSL